MTPNQLRTPRRDKMLTFGSAPVAAASWGHRPVVSSPLSSSPMRASSPLSPIDTNKQPQRQVQSSPLQPPKFRFASRPRRPNPAVRRPEDVQETRRKTFLQRVRETSEDRTWKRRDIEGQLLKTSWLDNIAHLSRDAPAYSDADIDDALAFQQETAEAGGGEVTMSDCIDDDDGLDVAIASFEHAHASLSQCGQPGSPTISDDEYDDIFAELIAEEERHQYLQQQQRPPKIHTSLDEMDVTMGSAETQ